MWQNEKSFFKKITAFYALVKFKCPEKATKICPSQNIWTLEKKNSALFLLKTKLLMKRHYCNGCNKKRDYILFCQHPNKRLALCTCFVRDLPIELLRTPLEYCQAMKSRTELAATNSYKQVFCIKFSFEWTKYTFFVC